MHKAAKGGVVMLAMEGSTQFTVQSTPPRVTETVLEERKGVMAEVTRSKCRDPESVAAREGGDELERVAARDSRDSLA